MAALSGSTEHHAPGVNPETRKSCTPVHLHRDGVTLNFDLLTPKSNQFISVPRCTSDKSLAKIRQQILEISRKQNYHVNHGRTDERTAERTDDPKTYSLRRRLSAAEA